MAQDLDENAGKKHGALLSPDGKEINDMKIKTFLMDFEGMNSLQQKEILDKINEKAPIRSGWIKNTETNETETFPFYYWDGKQLRR